MTNAVDLLFRLTTAAGLIVVRDFSSLGATGFDRKATLALISGKDPGVLVEEANLDHDGGLGPVRRGNDHVDLSAETLLRQGVELDLAGLSFLHLLEVRLRHVGLDLQGVHVGDGHNGRLGVGGGAQGRYDVSDVGILGENDGVKGRPKEGVLHAHLRPLEGGLGGLHGGLGAGNAGNGLLVAGLGCVVLGLCRVLLGEKPLLPLVGDLCILLLRAGLGKAVSGNTQVRLGLVPGRRCVSPSSLAMMSPFFTRLPSST